jgi:hypothetical protein
MDAFEQGRRQMDADAVQTLLLSLTAPCFESRLMRAAFPDLTIHRADPLTLYQRHFLLFHLLYRLKDRFYPRGKHLHVHFMRTFLTDYPPAGRCRFYHPHDGRFCGETTGGDDYCRFHREKVGDDALALLSARHFYLDPSNFYAMDAETIEAFMNGTWEILAHCDDYRNSFAALDLPMSADIPMVKKRFRRLAKRHHPDRGGGSPDRFHDINRAYQVLMRLLPLRPDVAAGAERDTG